MKGKYATKVKKFSSRIGFIALRFLFFIAFAKREMQVLFSMATGNVELMHYCFPKHLRM